MLHAFVDIIAPCLHTVIEFEVGKIHVVKRLYSEDIMTKNKILFMAYSNASVIDLLMQAFQPVHSG